MTTPAPVTESAAARDLAGYMTRQVRTATRRDQPWPYCVTGPLLPPPFAREFITHTFSGALVTASRVSGDKTYRLATHRVGGAADPLPARLLRAVVDSTPYRQALSELLGTDVSGTRVEVDAWEYGPGDWLSPHVDKPEKRVTQILYLTDGWHPRDRARLLLLRDGEAGSVAHAVPPHFLTSVIFVPSARSWHAVEPPAPGGYRRRSVTVTYLSPEVP